MTRHPRALATIALTTAAFASVLTGCGNDTSDVGGSGGSGSHGDLANASFLSTHVTKDGQDYPLVQGTRISLRFWDSRLSAQAGCNILGGNATLSDGVIDVADGLSMTEMGCAKQLMQQDTWLADLLSTGPVATLDNGRLTLTSGDTVVELLNEETANPDRPLTGTTWTLESTGGSSSDSSVSSVPDGVESTLTIDDSGRVSIRPGCNTGGGEATVGDGSIDFGPIALTRMACPTTQMDTEDFVMSVVDGTVQFSIDADVLTLTKGENVLVYRTR
ncbi:MAG TPA: META domain-containing protein [Nocardioidaceae bacterium]|nr:META domain-containing protein [Nocardioidaceae bacterium]